MKKVLIVDDEQSIRDMLARFLVKKGYGVCEAAGGAEALEVIKRERPNAVLLDIRMPDMNGVEALRKIKEIDPDVGVIMVTAVSDSKTAVECLELGAFDYITKPLSLKYLEECLLAKLMGSE
jgi:DNA-binding NtrC family response regulator